MFLLIIGNSWLKINPSQFGYNSSEKTDNPEILVFNENVGPGERLPGVEYYNHPKVPQIINNILVKITLRKDIVNNVAPVIYSYMLAAKVSTVWIYQQYRKKDF